MANIFDKPTDQKYIETFIPRPLEEIGNMAKNWTDNFNKDLSKLEVSDPIAKLNPRASFKVYDASVPGGERDISLDWNNQKNNYLQQLNSQKNKIVDEYMASGDEEAFKRNSRNYLNEASGVYNNFAQKEQVAKQIQDYNKELAKNGEYALNSHLGQKLKAYNTKFYQDAANGIDQDYAPSSVAKYTNRTDEVKNYFKEIGSEVLEDISSPTGTGYIRTTHREGRPVTKIEGLFNSWFDNSNSKADIILEGLDFAAKHGINSEAIMKVKRPVSKDPKTGEITYKEEEMPWIKAYEEDAANELLNEARGFSSSTGGTRLTNDRTYMWRSDNEKAEKLLQENRDNAFRGDPLQSSVFIDNLQNDDDNYKTLTSSNVIKDTGAGLVLNFAELTDDRAATAPSPFKLSPPGMSFMSKFFLDPNNNQSNGAKKPYISSSKTKAEKTQALNTFMEKIHKGIGSNIPLNSANYQAILNEWNKYDKVRFYDETMSKAASEAESSRATRNYNNYDFYNVNDLNTPLPDSERPVLGAKDEVILNATKTNISGKSFQTGFIKHANNSDGTTIPITPIVVRSGDEIHNNYFDNMSSSTIKAVEYESGKNEGKKRIIKGKTPDLDITLPGVNLNTVILPGVGELETIGIKDQEGKKTTQFILNPLPTKQNPYPKSIIYTSQAQAQREIHAKFYTTQAGQNVVDELGTNQAIWSQTQKNEKYYNDDGESGGEEGGWLQTPASPLEE